MLASSILTLFWQTFKAIWQIVIVVIDQILKKPSGNLITLLIEPHSTLLNVQQCEVVFYVEATAIPGDGISQRRVRVRRCGRRGTRRNLGNIKRNVRPDRVNLISSRHPSGENDDNEKTTF